MDACVMACLKLVNQRKPRASYNAAVIWDFERRMAEDQTVTGGGKLKGSKAYYNVTHEDAAGISGGYSVMLHSAANSEKLYLNAA